MIKNAAKGHTSWKHQRITALVMILSLVFFLVTLCCHKSGTAQDLLNWLQHPLGKTCAFLAMNTLFYHSFLGIKMILEDYLPIKAVQQAALFVSFILHLFFATLGSILILF